MNHNGAAGLTSPRDGQSRKRSHEGKLVNGNQKSPRPDGPVTAPTTITAASLPGLNGQSDQPTMNGAAPTVSAQMAHLPPELAHCSSEHYHPLSKLLARMSQECYNDLTETLTAMADIQPPQSNGLSNGLGAHLQDNSTSNRDKKLLILKFAHDQRAKFIKLLVLYDWAREYSEGVVKMVDVFQWCQRQLQEMDHVVWDMNNTKMSMATLRQQNPDIRTALEVLSTGKASWIPDLGFIPLDPMSSEKSRKLLRYMNTSLAIRLNVHENLPRHLRKWRVASGRATFTMPGEFELDTTAFSEDTSDQWHFIDIRLLFSPAPTVAADGRFYIFVKQQLDNILRQSGLSACFDFLHNFILTHKIAILRLQAYELLRADWAGALKVEPVHRSLVVSYWLDRPGRKSWVEINLASGKPKNGKVSWRGPGIASLGIRWFRQGVEVKHVDLKIDWNNLSMERILKRVIALHTSHFLQTARHQITSRLSERSWTKASLNLSESEPCDCSFELSLGSPENRIVASMDPVIGKFELRPCTPNAARAERAINQSKEPLASISAILPQLLSSSLLELVQQCTSRLGWRPAARYALKIDAVKQAVKLEVMQYALYTPRGWTTKGSGGNMITKWALAAIIDPSGESWWILELGTGGTTIDFAERITTESLSRQKLPVNLKTLASIDRIAAQLICFRITDRELSKRSIPCNLERQLALRPVNSHLVGSQDALHGWVLRLRAPDLLSSKPDEEQWLQPGLKVTCHGFRADLRNIWYIVSGFMIKTRDIDMRQLMAGSTQQDINFSENGSFSILLSTPFGQPMVDQATARLRDIDRLRSFAITLKKRKMVLKASSLEQVEFQYGKDCLATVNFAGDQGGIQVVFPPGNPHNGLATHLNNIINDKSPAPAALRQEDNSGLDRFCTTLMYTRPIIATLNELRDAQPGNVSNPRFHPRSVGTYRLEYTNPLCSFDIRIRPKQDAAFWHIEDNYRKNLDERSAAERFKERDRLDTLKAALAVLFRSQGEGWVGIRSGVVAELDGIPNALKKLNETVLSCEVAGGLGYQLSRTPSSGVPPNVRPNPQGGGAPGGTANMRRPQDNVNNNAHPLNLPNGRQVPLGRGAGPVTMGTSSEPINLD
ncbi:mediator complex subunit MED14-domain-containing protein [Clohesyomyces aquaticus]|uniref:Mediator of RNA polymerase II transcription subunit 14 n=1 Tax=Clohesyomyces aquaticus TaxID=1231657 RepID=A0A1Y1ZZX8_9PLEO|nr:mediator complex subunit MED14-domain-containing protein [Clohesyomyces aquaticus]